MDAKVTTVARISYLAALFTAYAEFQANGALKVILVCLGLSLLGTAFIITVFFADDRQRSPSDEPIEASKQQALVISGVALSGLILAVSIRSPSLGALGLSALAIALLRWTGHPSRANILSFTLNSIAVTAAVYLVLLRIASLNSLDALTLNAFNYVGKALNLLGISGISEMHHALVVNGHPIDVSLLIRPDLLAIPVSLLITFHKDLMRILSFSAASFIALLLYTAMTVWLSTTLIGGILNSVWWTVTSGLVYAILIMAIVRPDGFGTINRRGTELAYGLAAAGLLLLALYGSFLSRQRHTGEIWIDEAHGDWEPTAGILDTNSYGRNTTYNYVLLAEWLKQHYKVRIVRKPFPDSITCQVLIVKLPTIRFTESEIAAVKQYVQRGGTLIVIGDHTNLFGSQKVANELLSPMGVWLRDDAVIPFQGREYSHKFRWWNSSFVFRGISDLNFQTSCTIAASALRAEPLMLATSAVAEAAEYSNDRFFGDLTVSPDDRREPLCPCLLSPFGKGLVIIFGDSTVWSSFSFFTPPYKELLDRLIQFGLIRPDRIYRLVWLIVLATIAAGLLFFHTRKLYLLLISVLAIFAWRAAILWAVFPGVATPKLDQTRAVFVDVALSNIDLSTDIRTRSDLDLHTYSGFLSAMPRLGFWPEVKQLDYGTLANGSRVIIISPDKDVDERRQQELEEFVRRGGRVLVMLNATTKWPPAGLGMIRRFGVDCELATISKKEFKPAGPSLPAVVFALPLSTLYALRRERGVPGPGTAELQAGLMHVEPLLLTDEGVCSFGRKSLGKGWVYVLTGAEAFSQFVFGDVWGGVEPDPFRRNLYSRAYFVLNEFTKANEPLTTGVR